MSWRRLRSLLAPLLALTLLITSILPAAAAPLRPSSNEAISLLTSYGMVLGDENGNLNLMKPITRAEAATIFVRAMGQESAVKLLGNLSSFPDTNGHWSAPYVTVAFRLGLMKGRDTGLFDPGAEITNAEVLTVLLRIVKREPAGLWSPATIMATADELGLVEFSNPAAVANQRAIRGEIFQSLAWTLTTVPLADQGGKTALAAYIDKIAPQLTVQAVPSSTGAASIRVTGTAKGADYVLVNGNKVSLSGESFSSDVSLSFGSNSISVEAYDWAGNKDSESFTVGRAGEAARIVVTGEVNVKAGESAKVDVKAYDASGVELPTSLLKASVTNNMGTFDPTTATFKAGTKLGKGTIVLTSGSATATVNVQVMGQAAEAALLSIENNVTVTQGKSATITVRVLDILGQPVTWDSGRTITLTSLNTSALLVTSGATALTDRGVATFTVGGLTYGPAVVSASSSGMTATSTTVQVASSTRVVLVPSTTSAGADGMTPVTVRALLQNESGTAVTNTGSDIQIDLTATGGSQSNLTNRVLTIRSGSNTSAGMGDATLIPGFENETITISGTVRSGQPFSVVPTTVSFTKRQIGTPSRLELSGGGTHLPGTPVTFSVSVRDSQGNVVPTNNFAYQVQVTTDNNEALVGGMPPGLTVTLGNTALNPVAAATGSVVARTALGYSTLTVNYTKSGTVTLKLIPVNGAAGGWDSQGAGNFGSAYSSLGLTMSERSVTWAGTANKIAVSADLPSQGLQNQPVAILAANGSAQAKLKLQVLDANDGRVPAQGIATLKKVGVPLGTATTYSVQSANVVNGTAEFTVTSTTNVGVDEYELSYALNSSSTPITKSIKVYTTNAALARPSILAISGQSRLINRVAATDTYMEIQLPNYGANIFGTVRVYRANGSLIYTSPVMELNNFPYVQVPKANLTAGADSYYVVVHNGYGDSPTSERYPASPNTVTVEVLQAININQVRYTASTNTLTIYAPGVQSGGVVDLSKLQLQYQTNPASLPFTLGIPASNCTVTSGYITCTGVIIPASPNTLAVVTTADGWYRYDPTGTVAKADTTVTDNLIPGIGHISSAVLSFTMDASNHMTARITINGANLTGSTIYPEFIKIGTEPLGRPGQTLTAQSSTSLTFDLPNFYNTGSEATSIAAKIAALDGSAVSISAEAGWIRYSSDYGPAVVAAGGVFKSINLSSIQYVPGTAPEVPTLVITGSGFLGGQFRPAQLQIVDRSGAEVFTLDDAANTAAIDASGNRVVINLTDAQADLLNDPANNYRFNVFLISTTSTWFQSADGWNAIQLGNRLYPVGW